MTEERKVAGLREEEAMDRVRWRQMMLCGEGKAEKKQILLLRYNNAASIIVPGTSRQKL